MIFNFVKRIICGNENFILKDFSDVPKETVELIENGVLAFVDANNTGLNEEIQTYDEKIPVGLFIVKTTMIDDGDYDIDDNYIPYYTGMYEYFQCKFCPITGEKIEIVITETIDKTDEYNSLMEKTKLKGKKNIEIRQEAERKLEELVHSDFSKFNSVLN